MSDTAAPIFVFGALRSGTTLFRLMLDAHEGIANPGEFDFLARFLSKGADGAWRYDKDGLRMDRVFVAQGMTLPDRLDGPELLAHFIDEIRAKGEGAFTINLHTGLDKLVKIMPDLRAIHMLRDPRDVARSSIGMGWAGTLFHGVAHWIETEQAWDRVAARIAPEHALELRYETLLQDLEGELRRVCGFIGVPFSPAMLNYHENSSYDRPDPRLIEQWRRKIAPGDLALIEGRVGPLLAARGYAPSGAAPRVPGAAEAAALTLRNAVGRYRFAVGRFGFWLATAERTAARLGLPGPKKAVRARMNAIQQRLIK
jgi:hypothetical protein